jgi:hypothetical protein
MGGSGEYFGVRPDLSCYCKAIANGYALSACVGRDSLRKAAESVFFTGSYFALLLLRHQLFNDRQLSHFILHDSPRVRHGLLGLGSRDAFLRRIVRLS